MQLKLSWDQFKINCYNFWMLYVICRVTTNMYIMYTKGNEKIINVCYLKIRYTQRKALMDEMKDKIAMRYTENK